MFQEKKRKEEGQKYVEVQEKSPWEANGWMKEEWLCGTGDVSQTHPVTQPH